jgi:hypothetical protein
MRAMGPIEALGSGVARIEGLLRSLSDRLFGFIERGAAHRLGFALGWTAAHFVIVLGIVTPIFRANDNYGILLNVRAGLESPFLTLTLGSVLGFCYQSVAYEVPWFGIANFAALFLAMALFVHALSSTRGARKVFVPVLLLFSSAFASFLIKSGYNQSSVMLSGISALAFCTYLRGGLRTHRVAWGCGLALAFGASFRLRGAEGALLFLSPILLAVGPRLLRANWRSILIFALPILTLVAVETVWNQNFVSPEFAKYREFNALRGQFHDFPIERANLRNEALFAANQWTANDYDLLARWFFVDEGKYNLRTLGKIFELSVDLPHKVLSPKYLAKELKRLGRVYVRWAPIALLLVIGALMVPTWRNLLWTSGCFTFIALATLFMSTVYRFPARVGQPILFVALLGVMWGLIWGPLSNRRGGWLRLRRDGWRRLINGSFAALWAVALVQFLGLNLTDMEKVRAGSAKYRQTMARLDDQLRGKIVYVRAGSLEAEMENPLRVGRNHFEQVPNGWQSRSPIFYRFLESQGLTRGSELLPFAVDNEDFFFLYDRKGIEKIARFVRDTYGIHCKVLRYVDGGAFDNQLFQLRADPDATGGQRGFRFERREFGHRK